MTSMIMIMMMMMMMVMVMNRFGYNTWRDPLKPTVILEKMCKAAGVEPPVYQPGCVVVADQRFYEQELVETEEGHLHCTLFYVVSRRDETYVGRVCRYQAPLGRWSRLVLAPDVVWDRTQPVPRSRGVRGVSPHDAAVTLLR